MKLGLPEFSGFVLILGFLHQSLQKIPWWIFLSLVET